MQTNVHGPESEAVILHILVHHLSPIICRIELLPLCSRQLVYGPNKALVQTFFSLEWITPTSCFHVVEHLSLFLRTKTICTHPEKQQTCDKNRSHNDSDRGCQVHLPRNHHRRTQEPSMFDNMCAIKNRMTQDTDVCFTFATVLYCSCVTRVSCDHHVLTISKRRPLFTVTKVKLL